ncbi:MAG TPA: hypothetical protein VJK51_03745 [Candidatus Nanoarchaeia archaeon]|nr:hypothetical protein [Candidatus Nanoarchaeia archaeon]
MHNRYSHRAIAFLTVAIILMSVWFFWDTYTTGRAIDAERSLSGTGQAIFAIPRFREVPVTYSFVENTQENERECFSYERDRVRLAFEVLENETDGAVRFSESENGRIEVRCYVLKSEGYHLVSGEGSSTVIGGEIVGGTLRLYTTRNCGVWPDVEIHELLHIFGFGHIDDRTSIMYPEQLKCDLGSVDGEIVQELKEVYG